jgi:hypothetical protein
MEENEDCLLDPAFSLQRGSERNPTAGDVPRGFASERRYTRKHKCFGIVSQSQPSHQQ